MSDRGTTGTSGATTEPNMNVGRAWHNLWYRLLVDSRRDLIRAQTIVRHVRGSHARRR